MTMPTSVTSPQLDCRKDDPGDGPMLVLSPSRNAFDLNHISLLVQHQLLLVTMTSSSKSDFNSVRLGVSGKINNSSVVLRWLSG